MIIKASFRQGDVEVELLEHRGDWHIYVMVCGVVERESTQVFQARVIAVQRFIELVRIHVDTIG